MYTIYIVLLSMAIRCSSMLTKSLQILIKDSHFYCFQHRWWNGTKGVRESVKRLTGCWSFRESIEKLSGSNHELQDCKKELISLFFVYQRTWVVKVE